MRKKIKKGFEKIEKKKDVEAYGEHVVVVVVEDGVVEGDVVEVVLLVGEAVVHHIDRRYHQGGWRVVWLGMNLVACRFGLDMRQSRDRVDSTSVGRQ